MASLFECRRSAENVGVRRITLCGSDVRSGAFSAPALFLVDNTGIDKVTARRLAAREQARKAEQMRLEKTIQVEEERRKAFKP
jgi:hypothetical protein